LRVNLSKSSIVPGGEVDKAHLLVGILDCGVESLPSLYLGLPLDEKFKEKSIWDHLLRDLKRDSLVGNQSILRKGVD